MRLPPVPDDLSRDQLVKRARSTIQVAGALASTARGAAPALLKEVPHLVGSVAGTAWAVGSGLAHRARGGAESRVPGIGAHQGPDVETERDAVLPPAAQAAPAPEADEPALSTALEVGAPGSAAPAVEKAALQAAGEADFVSGSVLTHDELPLPDFDHLTIGSLRNKIRPLSVTELVQLREWERAHADRLPVITALENRIAKLQADSADSGQPKLVDASS